MSEPGLRAASVDDQAVVVRDLIDIGDLTQASRLFASVWREPDGAAPISAHLLAALRLSGNYVSGAYDGAGRLVGASAGWAAPPARGELHSHITGVAEGLQSRGVGRALKLHQREWALAHGLSSITWTFDPLVRRNAAFNLRTLGARAESYLRNVYGEMEDTLNVGGESDRLFVRWELTRAPGTSGAEPAAAVVSALVPTPPDIEAIRRDDPAEAIRWRLRLREQLEPVLASGGSVAGLTRDGEYVLEGGS